MNINEFEKEIHKNAVKHGWWDEQRSFAEEDRAGKPMIYIKDGKPEGKAVEMADCIIRILDWMGRANIDAEDVIATKHAYNETRPYKHGKKY